jgi:hypothetical protein
VFPDPIAEQDVDRAHSFIRRQRLSENCACAISYECALSARETRCHLARTGRSDQSNLEHSTVQPCQLTACDPHAHDIIAQASVEQLAARDDPVLPFRERENRCFRRSARAAHLPAG